MSYTKVQEIESAIESLTPEDLRQLYSWLDQQGPQPIYAHMESDLSAGLFDNAIERALQAEKSDDLRSL